MYRHINIGFINVILITDLHQTYLYIYNCSLMFNYICIHSLIYIGTNIGHFYKGDLVINY